MDAFGISGLMTNDRDTRVDVPLRVFSRTYYPNLVELYRLIGVEIKVGLYSHIIFRIINFVFVVFSGRRLFFLVRDVFTGA